MSYLRFKQSKVSFILHRHHVVSVLWLWVRPVYPGTTQCALGVLRNLVLRHWLATRQLVKRKNSPSAPCF